MHALPSWLNLSSALRRCSSPPSLLPGKDSKEDKRVPFPFLISISPCGENMQVRGVSQAFQASQLGDTAMAPKWRSGLLQKSILPLRGGQHGIAGLVTLSWSSQATPKSDGLTRPKTRLDSIYHGYLISSNCVFSIFFLIFKKPNQYSKLFSSLVNWVLYITYTIYQYLFLYSWSVAKYSFILTLGENLIVASDLLNVPSAVLYSLLT